MKQHHVPGRKLRRQGIRRIMAHSRSWAPGVRFLHITVSMPVGVTLAIPAAAWACGPGAVIAVIAATATACCAAVLLVCFAIDREDRFERLTRAVTAMLATFSWAGVDMAEDPGQFPSRAHGSSRRC